jgi:hypothetical protein
MLVPMRTPHLVSLGGKFIFASMSAFGAMALLASQRAGERGQITGLAGSVSTFGGRASCQLDWLSLLRWGRRLY